MPRFAPNPEAATAGMLILEKDDYTVEVTKCTPFIFDRDPNKISHGVAVSCKVVSEGQYKGKTITQRLFFHTSPSEDMAKRFLMAVFGFNSRNKSDEDTFNSTYGPKDWSYNTDDKSLGSAWDELTGKLLTLQAQEPKEVNGNLNQNFNAQPYNP